MKLKGLGRKVIIPRGERNNRIIQSSPLVHAPLVNGPPLVHGFWAKIFTPQLFSTTSVLCHFTNTIVLLLLLRFFTNNIGSGCKQKQFDACSSVVNYYFGIFYCSYQYFSIYWEYWNSPLVHGPPSCTVFGHFFIPPDDRARGGMTVIT